MNQLETDDSSNILHHDNDDIINDEDQELYTICLVTCYSEGEQGLRNTLESLACTEYNDSKKLLFIIADGLIKGEGNDQLTSEIILNLITENYYQYKNPRTKMPEPQSYVSIGTGNKQRNMARVHVGMYTSLDQMHKCPIIVVVKCGNPEEANDPKPGNRGKRDSQVILMNFLNRVIFNDRMSPLDYELTYQIHKTTGVFPDKYDLVLMVDADTKVKPDSLKYMVKAMVCDEKIMGLCGETRILNKTSSFVTGIQVFEYYISHHLSKAFESVFGGVTCLPGCFCMYRIKSRKLNTNYVVPILANPDIIAEYSQNVVDSLHKKNLLLLGEDRFLSTLMLKTFPKRKMMFVPQARCKTIVPDTFKVLLSQRRRWINSTIHNLIKLVFVNDLCGTFCFSMQFVVFFELCGTVVLPAALSFTIYILLSFIFSHSVEILPVILLFAILGLPGILIFLTSKNWHYVFWMLIYLIALPIWNFILPLYAVWHMDDFSWGETRKISSSQSSSNNETKSNNDIELDITSNENKYKRVPFKQWSEYEFERLLDSKSKSTSKEHSSMKTLSMGNLLASPLLRRASTSTLASINSSVYSTLINNYSINGGSNSKMNYHDLYQRSQNNNSELYSAKKNSEIDKFEGLFGKSDISEIKKLDISKKSFYLDKNLLNSSGFLNSQEFSNFDISSIKNNGSRNSKRFSILNNTIVDSISNGGSSNRNSVSDMSYSPNDMRNKLNKNRKRYSDINYINSDRNSHKEPIQNYKNTHDTSSNININRHSNLNISSYIDSNDFIINNSSNNNNNKIIISNKNRHSNDAYEISLDKKSSKSNKKNSSSNALNSRNIYNIKNDNNGHHHKSSNNTVNNNNNTNIKSDKRDINLNAISNKKKINSYNNRNSNDSILTNNTQNRNLHASDNSNIINNYTKNNKHKIIDNNSIIINEIKTNDTNNNYKNMKNMNSNIMNDVSDNKSKYGN
eukprot:jgi/Orpsp1_1/1184879/evm.model.c7180000091360.1